MPSKSNGGMVPLADLVVPAVLVGTREAIPHAAKAARGVVRKAKSAVNRVVRGKKATPTKKGKGK